MESVTPPAKYAEQAIGFPAQNPIVEEGGRNLVLTFHRMCSGNFKFLFPQSSQAWLVPELRFNTFQWPPFPGVAQKPMDLLNLLEPCIEYIKSQVTLLFF